MDFQMLTLMKPFLLQTAEFLSSEYNGKFPKICVVLPNKRGALFLKKYLREVAGKATWVPSIISVEDLVEHLSGLVCADNITLTIELYKCWTLIQENNNPANYQPESFHDFLKWSNTVLQDFNEIDRNLVSADEIFSNLKNIREIENWSLSQEPLTEFQQRYLSFMENLGTLYKLFRDKMLRDNTAWQGLACRVAAENVSKSSFVHHFEKIIFCGFNALNAAEIKIFSQLKLAGKAEFLWDIDEYYFNDSNQEAGDFLRKNFKNEKLRSSNFITNHLVTGEKKIDIIGVPRNIGQAEVAASKIKTWMQDKISTQNMAVVMADESLLFPMLSMIPDEVENLNVTLEYPLQQTSVYDFYEQILQLHVQAESGNKKAISFYFKDLYRLFYNPCFKILYNGKGEFSAQGFIERIKKFNLSFVSFSWLKKLMGEHYDQVNFLFEKWEKGLSALDSLEQANNAFKSYYVSKENISTLQKIEFEFVLSFSQVINRLKDLIKEHPAINNLHSVYQLLRQVVTEKSVPFFGQPLAGLQLMGVLETRTLDFENIIILGMNEGILPSGRSGNSFIPYDLKRYFGIPLHSEKDAVYAYHFYRLLQRAKNICFVYNTETDTFGSGEKSRFLTQIEMELAVKNPQAKINSAILSGTLSPQHESAIIISKDKVVLEKLEKKCSPENLSGLSPSSLNLYSDCSLKFYFKYIAGMQEEEEVEEDMEAGTFGSILHGVLENLYRPHLGNDLKAQDLNFKEERISEEIKKVYASLYQEEDFLKGKNLLAANVIGIFVGKMLQQDIELINDLQKRKAHLKMLKLEEPLEHVVNVLAGAKNIPVKISGKVDRIDMEGEFFRIVDYKSSVKDSDNFIFSNFEELFNEDGNNKMLQLFTYAWLAWKNNLCRPNQLLPCIIPFRNYSGKPNRILDIKKNPLLFTETILLDFEKHLGMFISGMFDTSVSFTQTKDQKMCEYCGYNVICNR